MNPSKIPDELAGLTPEQLNTVHLWLDEYTYELLLPKLKAELGVDISRSKLSRYSCSRDLADDIEDATGLTVQVQDLIDMYNGQPIHFDQASLILIQKRVLELAADSKTKPGLLKDLFRIATYADRKSWVDHRKEINAARLALDNRKQELREKQFEHQKSIDEKKFPAPEPPPKPLTLQQQQERIWDIFHIPEEERVRRRALAGWTPSNPGDTASSTPTATSVGTSAAAASGSTLSQTNKDNENPEVRKNTTPSALSQSPNFPLLVAGAARTEGHGEGERSSLINPESNNPVYCTPSGNPLRPDQKELATWPPSMTEVEKDIAVLPSGIDHSIKASDPATWPMYYKWIRSRGNIALFDYLCQNQIRTATPLCYIPAELIHSTAQPSATDPDYIHAVEHWGITFYARHPLTNVWLTPDQSDPHLSNP
jgi:hypothetical protein